MQGFSTGVWAEKWRSVNGDNGGSVIATGRQLTKKVLRDWGWGFSRWNNLSSVSFLLCFFPLLSLSCLLPRLSRKTLNFAVTLPHFCPSLSDPDMARLLFLILLSAFPSPVVPIHNSSAGGNWHVSLVLSLPGTEYVQESESLAVCVCL